MLLSVSLTGYADTFRIELDYMGDDTDGHDHMPQQIVLDAVIQMFACQGHTLIIDLDDEVTHYDFLTGDPSADCGNFWGYTGVANTYRSLRDANFDREGQDGWHYAIFAHQYRVDADPNNAGSGCQNTTSSGRANGGDAFIVTLGAFDGNVGTLYAQAATLAHEFGHNLGLNHCGGQICGSNNTPNGDPNWVGPQVPNLPSVMSYNYQLSGVRTRLISNGLAFDEALFKEIDFSHGRMCGWNENSLNESIGTIMLPVDFNCDNDVNDSGIQQDVNFGGTGMGNSAPWCGVADQVRSFVSDFDEWGNLSDGAALVAAAKGGDGEAYFRLEERTLKQEPCITSEQWERQREFDITLGSGPALTVESCINGENVYIGDFFFAELGICQLPFASVENAQTSSPSNSVYYFWPNTYNEDGSLLLNKRGKYFCKTGSALIR